MAYCGNLPEEQQRRQPFEIDLDIAVDMSMASSSDDLSHTVDYVWMLEEINSYFKDNKIKLIEKMAQVVADIVLKDERAIQVGVKLRKLQPPVSYPVGSSGISITRSRS